MAETHKEIERKLTTILAADVAGYSRLMADNEEQTLETFREYKQLFESLITLHGGRIFNTAGDSVLAEFTSPVEAVRCATELQPVLRTRNEKLADTRRVRFRIGIHVGDVIVQNTDLLGDGVNIAARLQAAAAPEGICISGSVYDQVQDKLSLTFKPLGQQTYKNIPRPIRTFSVINVEGRPLPSPRTILGYTGSRPAWILALTITIAASGAYWTYSELTKDAPIPGALLQDPPVGTLPDGRRALVDDGWCPKGQIKELIGGNTATHKPRHAQCISRNQALELKPNL